MISLLASAALGSAQENDATLALEMVNKARHGNGVPPLVWSAELSAYAQF